MLIQYIPLIISVVAIMCLGYLVFEAWKLDNFRHNVRPGDVVNYKSAGDVEFKEVVSRPSREIVILKNIDDDFSIPFRALINKIYPL